MTGRIAWGSYSGEDIERLVATYICTKHPDANHIRPSIGDRGIDLFRTLDDGTVSVYQIKRFSSNLTASQKAQIERSWAAMMTFISAKKWVVSEWNLIMPLNPTLENLEWLDGVTKTSGVAVNWLGLTHVECWAAEMPHVADYYLDGGVEAMRAKVERALAAARFPDVTNWSAMKDQLMAIQAMFQEADPHYRYEISLLGDFEQGWKEYKPKPGLVVSAMEQLPNGGMLRIDTIAKHRLSAILAPIRVKVTFKPENDVDRARLRDFLDFGTPLLKMPASFEEKSSGACLQIADELIEGYVSASGSNEGPNLSVALENACASNLAFERTSYSSGSNGYVWKGQDALGFMSVEMRAVHDECRIDFEIKWDITSLEGASAGAVRRLSRFFVDAGDEPIKLCVNGFDVGMILSQDFEFPKERAAAVFDIAKALEEINRISDREIPYPNIALLSGRCWRQIENVTELATRKRLVHYWEILRIDRPSFVLPDTPQLLRIIRPLSFEIGGNAYECGLVESFAIAHMVEAGDSLIMAPVEEYGDQMVTTAIPRTSETIALIGSVACAEAPSVDDWCKFVQSAEEDSSDTDG